MDEHGSILSLLTTRFILWNIENFHFNGKFPIEMEIFMINTWFVYHQFENSTFETRPKNLK